jgi:hypothetical protein
MNTVFWVSISGWMAIIALGVEVTLAYLLRRSMLSEWLGLTQTFSGTALRRMRPHYALGAMLPLITVAHAWMPMAAGRLRGSDMFGLWLATFALLALMLQLVIGVALVNTAGSDRRNLRRVHLVCMFVVSGLVAAHVVLNA